MSKKRNLSKILVIDDDDEYNFLTEDTFTETGLDCCLTFKERATDTLNYLEQRKDHFPDLILLDINMPLMNGWEFLKEYEKRSYHLKYNTQIIMMSSSVYEEDKIKAKTFNKVVEYIEKPLSVENIFFIQENFF